ncbi:ABC transporter substrate-binding protein [Phytomonospora endophytica]|uniref:Iron complex transport system substrate-binding protein n=1 Tax=Phytomonospora endophytica TaxID=714109 RepID=A0A841FJY8_9ACTN|nr:ABC transporter substrate-binding protein [Phytomonospora endophytica]MBB6034148.1 iron complex transport system substrate-binding protein [Phytomonospora endophytica]GIG66540.1 ABC transporter substrate-binding protein [Phytomonospora endophytica]
MRSPLTSSLSRRGLLTAGGALGLGALLAACGSKDDGGSPAGSWTFTDDRGQIATLDAAPKRIVAFIGVAAALHDLGLGDRVVGVFGPTTAADGTKDAQAGDLDVSKVTVLGNAWGEFNVEEYAKLNPDLLVSNMFDDTLWFVPAESSEKILGLVPSVGIKTFDMPLSKPIDRFAELAGAIGADLASPATAEAKTRFETAAQAVREATAANPGIKVMACAAWTDLFYVSTPARNSDLIFFKELGVDLLVPDSVNADGYFEELSYENLDKYDADLLLLDERTQGLQPAQLAEKPAWAKLPAVEAGQITPWAPEPRFSYAGCAPLLERLAESIASARKVV